MGEWFEGAPELSEHDSIPGELTDYDFMIIVITSILIGLVMYRDEVAKKMMTGWGLLELYLNDNPIKLGQLLMKKMRVLGGAVAKITPNNAGTTSELTIKSSINDFVRMLSEPISSLWESFSSQQEAARVKSARQLLEHKVTQKGEENRILVQEIEQLRAYLAQKQAEEAELNERVAAKPEAQPEAQAQAREAQPEAQPEAQAQALEAQPEAPPPPPIAAAPTPLPAQSAQSLAPPPIGAAQTPPPLGIGAPAAPPPPPPPLPPARRGQIQQDRKLPSAPPAPVAQAAAAAAEARDGLMAAIAGGGGLLRKVDPAQVKTENAAAAASAGGHDGLMAQIAARKTLNKVKPEDRPRRKTEDTTLMDAINKSNMRRQGGTHPAEDIPATASAVALEAAFKYTIEHDLTLRKKNEIEQLEEHIKKIEVDTVTKSQEKGKGNVLEQDLLEIALEKNNLAIVEKKQEINRLRRVSLPSPKIQMAREESKRKALLALKIIDNSLHDTFINDNKDLQKDYNDYSNLQELGIKAQKRICTYAKERVFNVCNDSNQLKVTVESLAAIRAAHNNEESVKIPYGNKILFEAYKCALQYSAFANYETLSDYHTAKSPDNILVSDIYHPPEQGGEEYKQKGIDLHTNYINALIIFQENFANDASKFKEEIEDGVFGAYKKIKDDYGAYEYTYFASLDKEQVEELNGVLHKYYDNEQGMQHQIEGFTEDEYDKAQFETNRAESVLGKLRGGRAATCAVRLLRFRSAVS